MDSSVVESSAITWPSFIESPLLDLVSEREEFERIVLKDGTEQAPRYQELKQELNRNGTLPMADACALATVESLALCLRPFSGELGILHPFDTRLRTVFRMRRTLQASGMLSGFGDFVGIIASGVTVPEVLGMSASVDIKNAERLSELSLGRLEQPLSYFGRYKKDISSPAAVVSYDKRRFFAFDPDRRMQSEIARGRQYLPPELELEYAKWSLADFIHSTRKDFSDLVWLRTEPRIVLDSRIPADHNGEVNIKRATTIIASLSDKLRTGGQLEITVGTGNSPHGLLNRFELVRVLNASASRLGLGYRVISHEIGALAEHGIDPNGDVLSVVMSKQ